MIPSHSQRRTFHRVQFPIAERPRWIVGDSTFVVVDLAEASCRLDPRGHHAVDSAQPLSGILRFADGDQVQVEGQIVRQDSDGIVVQFSKGVALKKMAALQRTLFQKYPVLRDLETTQTARGG